MTTPAQTKTCIEGVSHLQTQTDDDQEMFEESRIEEVQALLWDVSFFVDASAAKGQRLHSSRFVDLLEPDDKKRSRLCVAAFHDNDHGLFPAAPTIKKLSTRLLLTLCATDKINLHTRNVTKASC